MVLDVKSYVKDCKSKLKTRIVTSDNPAPCLAIIQCNNDPASNAYIKGKIADCKEVGIKTILYKREDITRTKELTGLIDELNNTDSINGIIVQLPLPDSIGDISTRIDPKKDVDGFNPISEFIPCTALGIVRYLLEIFYDLTGLNVCIINRSDIVGRPLADLLLDQDATVTVCHSCTENLRDHIARADIVITAVGQPDFITPDMVNEDQIIIDVGITRRDGKLYGDVSKECYDKVKAITPVPGGVGLLTRLELLENTVNAQWLNMEDKK